MKLVLGTRPTPTPPNPCSQTSTGQRRTTLPLTQSRQPSQKSREAKRLEPSPQGFPTHAKSDKPPLLQFDNATTGLLYTRPVRWTPFGFQCPESTRGLQCVKLLKGKGRNLCFAKGFKLLSWKILTRRDGSLRRTTLRGRYEAMTIANITLTAKPRPPACLAASLNPILFTHISHSPSLLRPRGPPAHDAVNHSRLISPQRLHDEAKFLNGRLWFRCISDLGNFLSSECQSGVFVESLIQHGDVT
ncbi:hypothetical protein FZEAL_10400 [Fusarium zealandicum]|uniref:Uncharacterized protein n=1 Tax=Fusarium zealandicum TaxID=1053134 RepID=A0A8H4U2B2_9HYPO|nr:hypothetical protein FZEAL_10400 [Fusarium zealandicum]